MSWQQVAVAVRARRKSMRLTQQEAAQKAGPGVTLAVWNALENARQESYRQRTLTAVATALCWSGDSIDRILAGQAPIESTSTTDVVRAIQDDVGLDERGKRALLSAYCALTGDDIP